MGLKRFALLLLFAIAVSLGVVSDASAGSIDDEGLQRLVVEADALVLPSLYEGFGLPPLEAMAAGVPVLVSRAASLPEICGDAALYCDPHDTADIARQLERLLSDAELRARLGRAGPAHARRFSWDAAADAYAEVLARLMQR